jgi:hypothetical protein
MPKMVVTVFDSRFIYPDLSKIKDSNGVRFELILNVY